MHIVAAGILFGGFAAAQLMECTTTNLNDGDQGTKTWRVSTKDCAEATNKLEAHFDYVAALSNPGCAEIVSSGDCAISMCNPSALTGSTPVVWGELWAVTRTLHGRHKKDGKVAAYARLRDRPNHDYSVYVKLAKKGTGSPVPKKRRSLFGRPSVIDAAEIEARDDVNAAELRKRQNNRYDFNRANIDNTDLYVNIRVGFRDQEFVAINQVHNAQDNLIEAWRARPHTDGDVVGTPYAAPDNMRIQYEYVAHNNHNIGDVTEDELRRAATFAAEDRARGGNQGSFQMQIRRGVETLGHLAIHIWNRQLEGMGCG